MGRNIENLLVGRGNGEINGESSVFEISDIISEVVTLCSGECERRHIIVTHDRPQNDVNFFGQPIAVMRVVSNVLDFMIMRLTHSGEIKVFLNDSDEYVEIRIADNGPVVSPEQLEWLAGSTRNTSEQFITLSAGKADLDVARLIADSLGGGIIATPGENGGLIFTIMLPRMPFAFNQAEASSAALTI